MITYTTEAAKTVLARAPALTAGTIYSLTWPLVRQYGSKGGVAAKGGRPLATYATRPVRNEYDAILDDYDDASPSARARFAADEQAERLHGWDGVGQPPYDLSTLSPMAMPLRYILPIAKWLDAGRPGLTREHQYDTVIVDEAQDMGALELAAAGSLVADGGKLICYGDPGQALYAIPKGMGGSILPAAWTLGGERRTLSKGHRCGDPLASAAARVLNPIWRRPADTFRAPHRTEVVEWWPSSDDRFKPGDLVLGYSHRRVTSFIRDWGLKKVALVPSQSAAAKLTVCTGHAAKGQQAADVYILPWGKLALRRLDEQEPESLRLLYTMLTRAQGRVHVPSTLLARMQ